MAGTLLNADDMKMNGHTVLQVVCLLSEIKIGVILVYRVNFYI